jgi:hypothetical protein
MLENSCIGNDAANPAKASAKGWTNAYDACFSIMGRWSYNELISVILIKAFKLDTSF